MAQSLIEKLAAASFGSSLHGYNRSEVDAFLLATAQELADNATADLIRKAEAKGAASVPSASEAELARAKRRAAAIVSSARDEADAIRAEAAREAEQLCEAAMKGAEKIIELGKTGAADELERAVETLDDVELRPEPSGRFDREAWERREADADPATASLQERVA